MFRLLALVLTGLLAVPLAYARFSDELSYEALLAASDLVAIVEAVENKPADDAYPGERYGHPLDHFSATNTRFKVLAVLKGAAPEKGEAVVLHYSYNSRAQVIVNGASFIYFPVGTVQFELRAIKDGKPTGTIQQNAGSASWLAFLKRREDGRFEPVNRPEDSANSFRALHRSFFYPAAP